MIYSRQLYIDDGEKDAVGNTDTIRGKQQQPVKKSVRIEKTVTRTFGSTYTDVTLTAIDELTGKEIDSYVYTCHAWEVTSASNKLKDVDFADKLRERGYRVC